MANEIAVDLVINQKKLNDQIVIIEKQSKETGETVADNLSKPIDEKTSVSYSKLALKVAAIGAAGALLYKKLTEPAAAAEAVFAGFGETLGKVSDKMGETASAFGETKNSIVGFFGPILQFGIHIFKVVAPLATAVKLLKAFSGPITDAKSATIEFITPLGKMTIEFLKMIDPTGKLKEGLESLLDQIRSMKKSFDPALDATKSLGKGVIELIEPTAKFGIQLAIVAAGAIAAAVTVAALYYSFKTALAIVEFAESIRQTQNQFTIFATQVGVDASKIKEELENVARGTLDMTEVLKASNKGIIELGKGAAKLPELLAIAMKTSAAFGGTALENYEALITAISSGSTKQLKAVGIYLDSEKVIKDFAKAHGLIPSILSESAKQQALLNAVLTEGKRVTDGVETSVTKNTIAAKKFSIAIGDVKESLSLAFEGAFGNKVFSFMRVFNELVEGVSDNIKQRFGTAADKLKVDIKKIGDEIDRAREEAVNANERGGLFALLPAGWTATLRENLSKELFERVKILEERRRQMMTSLQNMNNDAARSVAGNAPKITPPPIFDQEGFNDQKLKFLQKVQEIHNSRADLDAQNASTTVELQKAFAERRLEVEKDFALKEQEFTRNYEGKKFADTELFNNAIVDLHEQKKAKILRITREEAQKIDEFSKIGRLAIVNGLTTAFAALGGALAKSQNAFEAFSKAIIGALGGLAIQIGSMLVAVGFGFAAAGAILPAWAVAGAGTIAAGLALIALGGALQALGAGGGGGEAAGAGGGGGGGGGLGGNPALTTPTEEKKPETNIVVNILGNVLDRRQTGLEIAEVIQETFGSNGIVFATAR